MNITHYEMTLWTLVGLLGQLLFTARFAVQWIASEKMKKSIIPVIFWYLSLGGGMILLFYAIHRKDIVIILGQVFGVFVYVRNLILIAAHRERKRLESADEKDSDTSSE